MEYYIKTEDNLYYIGIGGEYITKDESERWIFENKKLANWYIKGTNVFGGLRIKKLKEIP